MATKNQQIQRTPEHLPKPKFYLVTRQIEGQEKHDGFTGSDMFVRFWDGEGVLDNFAIYLERSDWVERVGDDYLQHTGVSVADYFKYWTEQRRFQVKEITKEQAAAFRAGVEEKKLALDRAQAAEIRRRTKAKSEGKDENAPDRMKQETEIAVRAQAALTPPAAAEAPKPEGEALPHEDGGAMAATVATSTGGK